MNNKPVYIMSLEASDIYYHNYREAYIRKEYLGMIPYSLELIKLKEEGLKTKYLEKRDKFISNDVINVKFKSNVKSAEEMIHSMENMIKYVSREDTKLEMLEYVELLKLHLEDSDLAWGNIKLDELRKELYNNGFIIKFKNPNTDKIKEEKYVVYKRSSAKSRTGQCLFIKKSLYNKMIKWSRLDLPLKKNQEIDLASLLAYESLVGSSLIDVIKIDTNNIFMISDVESNFKWESNIVKKGDNGFLDSVRGIGDVSNSLFDGESLLQSEYFPKDKSMMLLRNHMFKSASFNCDIQKYLKDNCPKNIDYDEWQLTDYFGNKKLAKDIHLIITPSSLKALKFSNVLDKNSELPMWNHWINKVNEDGNIFGICKYEKESKMGIDKFGNTLQQTSYQMINCLPINQKDIDELLYNEINYIEDLKNDNESFINEVLKNADLTNSNQVIHNLYRLNNEFENTSIFKKFKKQFNYTKVNHAKKGKIKIKGDYCVILGNPMEMLKHTIGELNLNDEFIELRNNEVYCSLYEESKTLVGFRNPNTSPSNVLVMENIYPNNIIKYFNLSENIIVVNAINFPIQDILSGCDYDSDTMLVSSEEKLVDVCKNFFGQYKVCLNYIEGQKKKYYLNTDSHHEIDNQLSHSQKNIGRVVNLGQLCMSTYWDLLNSGRSELEVSELLVKVDVMTVLSGIAIDMAKKFYDLDIQKEIQHVANNKLLKERKLKPNFWVYVSQSKSIKDKVEHYNTPMDYLINSLNKVKTAEPKYGNTYLSDLMNNFSIRNIHHKQLNNVNELMRNYNNKIKLIKSVDTEESDVLLHDLEKETLNKLKSWKLKADTISLLIKKLEETESELLIKTLKLLNESHYDEFEKVFKK